MVIIDSKFLNSVNKPLEYFNADLKVLNKAYEQTSIKEVKKRHKEIKSFVKEIKYIKDEIEKIKGHEDNGEHKTLLKYNLIKLIRVQANYLMHQSIVSKMLLEKKSKKYLKSLKNAVNLIKYFIRKFCEIKTREFELTIMQKLMWPIAVKPGRGIALVPRSKSINELSESISDNASIIKDNCEVLLYYFTDNGKKIHTRFNDKDRPQAQRIEEANKRIMKCIDKLKTIS